MRRLRIVGNNYKSDRAKLLFQRAQVGDPAVLQWEQSNRHDGYAHKVYLSDVLSSEGILAIGYIDRNQAARLAIWLGAFAYQSHRDRVACKFVCDNPGGYLELSILGIMLKEDTNDFINSVEGVN